MAEEQKNDAPVEEPKEEAAPAEEKTEAPAEKKAEEAPAPPEKKEVEVPAKFKKLVEEIEQMSVIDLHELVKTLEEKFGVSAAAVAVAGPAGAAAAEEGEEKDSFTVELTDGGASKIAVIKVVKEKLGLGLKEAKDLVDAAPTVLKEDVKKEDAEEMKKAIEEAGGKVELK